MKKYLFPSEQHIDILQRQIAGFRVEEVNERKEEEVEYAEVDVSFVTNTVDADWCNFNDQEGENPVGGRGQRGSARTDSEWSVFGRYYRPKKDKSVSKDNDDDRCWLWMGYLRNQGIAKSPTAKKKLKRKSITMATIPAALPPFDTVPASMAIQAH